MAARRQLGSGRTIVEPVGYAVTQFVASIAIVAGLGMAPVGLYLVGAAAILSWIDYRRLTEANPGLFPKVPRPEDLPMIKAVVRIGLIELGAMIALAIAAYSLVQTDGDRIQAIGPALVAGVLTLALNFWLKRTIARLEPGGPTEPGGPGGPGPGEPEDPS